MILYHFLEICAGRPLKLKFSYKTIGYGVKRLSGPSLQISDIEQNLKCPPAQICDLGILRRWTFKIFVGPRNFSNGLSMSQNHL